MRVRLIVLIAWAALSIQFGTACATRNVDLSSQDSQGPSAEREIACRVAFALKPFTSHLHPEREAPDELTDLRAMLKSYVASDVFGATRDQRGRDAFRDAFGDARGAITYFADGDYFVGGQLVGTGGISVVRACMLLGMPECDSLSFPFRPSEALGPISALADCGEKLWQVQPIAGLAVTLSMPMATLVQAQSLSDEREIACKLAFVLSLDGVTVLSPTGMDPTATAKIKSYIASSAYERTRNVEAREAFREAFEAARRMVTALERNNVLMALQDRDEGTSAVFDAACSNLALEECETAGDGSPAGAIVRVVASLRDCGARLWQISG